MIHAFYPGVGQPSDADAVLVSAGERVRLQDFVIPETVKLVTVTGVVLDEPGHPVRGAEVSLRDVRGGPLAGPPVSTDDDGRFFFSVTENGKYRIDAKREVSTDRERTAQWGSLDFTATAASSTLTVVMRPNVYR